MKKLKIAFLLICSLYLSSCQKNSTNTESRPQNLRIESLKNSLGIDVRKPRFRWQLSEDSKGQSAYRIQVFSSFSKMEDEEADIWDSKKVKSEDSQYISYKGPKLKSGQKYFWRVKVWDEHGRESVWSKPAYWSMGLLKPDDWKGQWITYDTTRASSQPLFKRDFTIDKKITRATAYISGLGYYQLNLNGKKVGDHVLDPGQTNYNKYAFYATYDITKQLRNGKNAVGVMLGDGWYNQNMVWGENMVYGVPRFICQIEVAFEDGSEKIIKTDKKWQWTNGPVIKSNVYAGETYDARKEVKGWSTPSPAKANWMKAKLALDNPASLKAQMMPPIKKIKELTPQNLFKVGKKKYIVDFRQNFAGWVRLQVKAPRGTEVTLRLAEQIFSDSTLNPKSTGVNVTHVVQTEKYITKGSAKEMWEPRFTYHGFRYVEISGLSKVDKNMLTGIVVHSDVQKTGRFKTSNPQINQLHKMANWSLTSNLYSLPTDCPTREKAGWLGDAHAIAQMAIYNYDMETFFTKYLHDIRSSAEDKVKTVFFKQKNNARYRRIKPSGIPFMVSPGKRRIGAASPDWGTALVQLPWYLYLYYGNERILKDFYPDMKQWVAYVEGLAPGHIVKNGLGDWAPPGGNGARKTPIPISSTAFHYLDTQIMKKTARVLNHPNEADHYRKLGEEIKKVFQNRFYDPKKKSFGSQTANAMALMLRLVPEGQSIETSDATKTLIEKNKGFITTGIFGLPRLFGALSDFGNADAAFNVLTKKGPNSFSYMWNHYDATTLWEILPVGKGKRSGGGSHNHAMQGGYDAWFYQGILGINPDPNNPGFKNIIFNPTFFKQLEWAKGSFDSPYGTITSNWSWKNNKLTWHIAVPPSTTAELKLSYDFADTLYVDQLQVKGSKNINSKGIAYYHYDLKSGQYNIRMIR